MSKYKANPTLVENITQSSESNIPIEIRDYSEFLPGINQTESLKRFFGSTLNQLLSSGSTQNINTYWGKLLNRDYNINQENYNTENDPIRKAYEFVPGVVDTSNNSPVSYINTIKRMQNLDFKIDNHDEAFAAPGYVLDLPINIDMFVNYSNYYWLDGNIPVIEISPAIGTITVDNIIGLDSYETPTLTNGKTITFLNGLRVDIEDTIYYVENVGGKGGIKLVEDNDMFLHIAPYTIHQTQKWDDSGFGTGNWDSYNDIFTIPADDRETFNKSYVVMERWSEDKNTWARTNNWYSIYAIQEAARFLEIDITTLTNNVTQAKRPIIEFKANMELHNHGNLKNSVNFILRDAPGDDLEVEEGINIQVDNRYVLDEDSTIYTYRGTNTDDDADTTSIESNDSVLVTTGNERGNVYIWNGTTWEKGQAKTTRNTSPQFNLYNDNLERINSIRTPIFQYKQNKTGNIDKELGFIPVYPNTTTKDFIFEWTLNNTRYDEETIGYYYWKNKDEYLNGWSNIRGGQRVPIIQTKVALNNQAIEFDLGTITYEYTNEYTIVKVGNNYRWYEHTPTGKLDVGRLNPDILLKNGREYTFNRLIDGILGTTTDPTDITSYGNIRFSDENHERISLRLNGQILEKGIHYTIDGSTVTTMTKHEENDIFELKYISDTDVAGAEYDVAPVHFFNPQNKPIADISLSVLTSHFERQLINLPGFTGQIYGKNNYHKIRKIHSFDGIIRQQIHSPTKFQHFLDQPGYNPIAAIRKTATDYDSFKSNFKNKTKQLWQTKTWNSTRELVDAALNDINIGKNENFKYANSDMVFWKGYREVIYTNSTLSTMSLPMIISVYDNIQNHIQVWLNNKPLQVGVDYTTENNNLTLTTALITTDTLTIRWYDHTTQSFIPYSTVKLGFFRPTQVEIIDSILYGHDGSQYNITNTDLYDMNSVDFDVVAACLYDLELRIFNNLVEHHHSSYDLDDFFPTENKIYPYSYQDINDRLDDWFNRWAVRNNTRISNEIIYVATDQFTWNYQTVGPGLANWKDLYIHYFGTYRPHTHPWEMMGYKVKPTWWDTTYSWDNTNLRSALITALQRGDIGDNPITPQISINAARDAYNWTTDTLVTNTGELNGPAAAGVVDEPTNIEKARPFELFGDWGSVENKWRVTSNYRFALAEVFLQLRPYQIFETFWNVNRWRIDNQVAEAQQVIIDTSNRTDTNEPHNLLKDNNSYSRYFGWNAICSEEYQYDRTDTRNLFTSLKALDHRHIIHVGGYTDKKLLNLYLDGSYDSGRIQIPSIDYDIILDENAPIKNVFFSGIKIEKEKIENSISFRYRISGYDFDKGYFNSYPSSTSGRQIVENVGDTTVVRYQSYRNNPNRIPYNTTFSRKQELYEFLLGVGEYYNSIGFKIMDKWEEQSLDAIKWSLSNDTTSFFINGIDDILLYEHGTQGVALPADVNYNGNMNVLNKYGLGIKKSDLLVLRNTESTEYSAEQDIFGLGINIVESEHMIILKNNQTGNLIYNAAIGLAQPRILIVGEKTRNWQGKIEAPGYVVNNDGIMGNIETSVRELEKDWINEETKLLEPLSRQTMLQNVGYSKPDFMKNTLVNDQSAYQFEKGKRNYKGTSEAIKAIGRNRNIYGSEFEIELHEKWMVRIGEYGDLSKRQPLQWIVDFDKIKGDSQQFRFNTNYVADQSGDLIIDLIQNDLNYVSGDYNKPFNKYPIIPADNTSIEDASVQSTFNKDAGLPLVTEIDYFLGRINNISDIYDPTQPYALIPNWNSAVSYRIGDRIRRNGFAYQAIRNTAGINDETDNIKQTGTQVLPIVPNGQTLIFNEQTITFENYDVENIQNEIRITGNIENPIIPYGNIIRLDNNTIRFNSFGERTIYNDIILRGSVTNPTLTNYDGKEIVIYWANNNESLNSIIIPFSSYDDYKTASNIWISAFISTEHTPDINIINTRLEALEALRVAYIQDNNIEDWENWITIYHEIGVVNPTYVSDQAANNRNANWVNAANDLVVADLNLIRDFIGSEEEILFNDINNFNKTLEHSSHLANYNEDLSDLKNLFDLIEYINTNGDEIISPEKRYPITRPLDYAIDDLDTIIEKINAVMTQNNRSDIIAENINNVLVIRRTNTNEGYRFGISSDNELGFYSDDTDIVATSRQVNQNIDSTLDNIIAIINEENLNGITAAEENNRLIIISQNEELNIGTSSGLSNVGIDTGTINATFRTIRTPIDSGSELADIIEQINDDINLNNIQADRSNERLVITYFGDTLVIGDGTANGVIGLQSGEYSRLGLDIDNAFNINDWEQISDPANFNIWIVDNIGSNPNIQNIRNGYNVYQTVDINLGIEECCAGVQVGDNALIRTTENHNLNSDDLVLILNSTCVPSIDGIHRVSYIDDRDKFFIDTFIEQKGFTGKVIPLRSVRFNNTNELENTLTDRKFINDEIGLRIGTKMFVDDIFVNGRSTNESGVYELYLFVDEEEEIEELRYRLIRKGEAKTRNDIIQNARLFNSQTKQTLISYEVFDPLKGIIPGAADKEIDIKSEIDIAYYNNSTSSEKQLNNNNSWGEIQIDQVWWDLSTAIYLDYDQGSHYYRQQNWGELFPTSSIDIYEWTKSPVPPDEYMEISTTGIAIDGVELTGIPYGEADQYGDIQYHWCEDIVLNPNTNQIETYYYFWVSKKTTTPNFERLYTVQQIEELIRNPQTQGIHWIAASNVDSILVSGLDNISTNDELTIQVNFNRRESAYHQEFILIPENDPQFIIPEVLHIGLHDSMTGYVHLTNTVSYTIWSIDSTYERDDVVKSSDNYYQCHVLESQGIDPAGDTNNENWIRLSVEEENPEGYSDSDDMVVKIRIPKTIPNYRNHRLVRYGAQLDQRQSWFTNIKAARQHFVNKINDQFRDIDLISSNIPWREEFDRTIRINGFDSDISQYWDYIDWFIEPVNFNNIDFIVENAKDINSLIPIEGNTALVIITDNTDVDNPIDRRVVYKFSDNEWKVVFREKGTIKFNDLLWNEQESLAGWDTSSWDAVEWDRSSSIAISFLLNSFYSKLWIGELQAMYNNLWLSMAQYVLQEQDEVDWIFKTSYTQMNVIDILDKKFNKYFRERPTDLMAYINTVKPFRTKIP